MKYCPKRSTKNVSFLQDCLKKIWYQAEIFLSNLLELLKSNSNNQIEQNKISFS
jgi:hypothetical protein